MNATIVLSMPTSHAPPSRIIATAPPKSSSTCCAVVGETWPNRLADGAAMPVPPRSANAASNAFATGCAGMRRPTLSWPPVTASPTCAARGRISVSGPGQNAAASLRAPSGNSRAQRSTCRRVAQMHDDRMIGGPSLGREYPVHGIGIAARRRPGRRPFRSGRRRVLRQPVVAPPAPPRRPSAPRSARSLRSLATRGAALRGRPERRGETARIRAFAKQCTRVPAARRAQRGRGATRSGDE